MRADARTVSEMNGRMVSSWACRTDWVTMRNLWWTDSQIKSEDCSQVWSGRYSWLLLHAHESSVRVCLWIEAAIAESILFAVIVLEFVSVPLKEPCLPLLLVYGFATLFSRGNRSCSSAQFNSSDRFLSSAGWSSEFLHRKLPPVQCTRLSAQTAPLFSQPTLRGSSQ